MSNPRTPTKPVERIIPIQLEFDIDDMRTNSVEGRKRLTSRPSQCVDVSSSQTQQNNEPDSDVEEVDGVEITSSNINDKEDEQNLNQSKQKLTDTPTRGRRIPQESEILDLDKNTTKPGNTPIKRELQIRIENMNMVTNQNKNTNQTRYENQSKENLRKKNQGKETPGTENSAKENKSKENQAKEIQSQDNNTKSETLTETENLMKPETSSKDLPSYNVPEKIIIVYDGVQDENFTSFQLNNGQKYSPFYMMKNALKFFLTNKLNLNELHEFALLVLNQNTAHWAHDFTRDVQDILDRLDCLTECATEDKFDMSSVFDIIRGQISPCLPNENTCIPPPYIVRAICLYGRSYTIPFCDETPEIKELLISKYFTFDVCMTHEPPCISNHAARIFKELQMFDSNGYAFSVHRNSAKLHEAMAKLLAHPLQRPYQSSARYSINVTG